LICNGENDRQLQALLDGIAKDAKQKAKTSPWGTEGTPSSGWVLVDYGDLIVHLFSPEMRKYYSLEELWSDSHIVLRLQ
jgi:ribosome-associated protein